MNSAEAPEIAAHRACATCRLQKVRCIPQDGSPDVCQRCARLGKHCVFAPLQKRKQRKRTDTRVAELEREMRTMRTLLDRKDSENARVESMAAENNGGNAQRGHAVGYPGHGEATPSGRDDPPDQDESDKEKVGSIAVEDAPGRRIDESYQDDCMDVVERGVLSLATARHLIDLYKNDLVHHFYFVVIDPSETADKLRQTKPTLFLAVLAAASGSLNPQLSKTLDQEILQMYANKVHIKSEKSLEIVQALLVSSVWYSPPNKFEQLKYYEYIHMALTMALDIGLGSRATSCSQHFPQTRTSPSTVAHPWKDLSNRDVSMSSRDSYSSLQHQNAAAELERRRTLLAVYGTCAGAAMSLRRSAMLRATSYVRECIEYIENAPHSLISDGILVNWVKLIVLGQEITTAFSYDDTGSIASFADRSTQGMLEDFDRRLTQSWEQIHTEHRSLCLKINYYTTRLYLYEIALHIDHTPEDFKAPYQLGTVKPRQQCSAEIPTRPLASAVADIVDSCHSLLEAFLTPEPKTMRGLPVFIYVRLSLAAFTLAKLTLSASHPESRIGQVLDHSSLEVRHYLDRVITHVSGIVGDLGCRVPSIFLGLLLKLRKWCAHPELITQAPAADSYQARLTETEVPWKSSYGNYGDAMNDEGVRIAAIAETRASSATSSGDVSGSSRTVAPSFTDLVNDHHAQGHLPAIYVPQSPNGDGPDPQLDLSWLPAGDQMEWDPSFHDFFQSGQTADFLAGMDAVDTFDPIYDAAHTRMPGT
ncbi:hypothetical protein MBLNU230_g3692t1 [Neophaeotheca triangularis]